jgi:hypothetical protein
VIAKKKSRNFCILGKEGRAISTTAQPTAIRLLFGGMFVLLHVQFFWGKIASKPLHFTTVQPAAIHVDKY